MQPTTDQACWTCAGHPLAEPPHAPGVYRFYNEAATLLYVGKSIDIATRVRSHFTDARSPGRQQRMMSAVRRIDCEFTAGETGALLRENAAIKAENPLYNRRQRRNRTLWTLRLVADVNGFLTVVPSNFSPGGERSETVFGLFRSPHHLQQAVAALAREQRLCLRVLGLERGRGPCFQSQIGRCGGACAGREGPEPHNERLLAALEYQRIAAWPFAGSVLLHEQSGGDTLPGQPRRQYHLVSHWSYQGSFARRDSARAAARHGEARAFDRDAYRIILAALRRGAVELLDGGSSEALVNPFARESLCTAESSCTSEP
jgi:hypothetical protein